MFLPSSTLLKARTQALQNFMELTSTQFDTIERISGLLADTTRANLDYIGQHGVSNRMNTQPELTVTPVAPVGLAFMDQLFEITGDAQKALITSAEAQVRIVDELVFAAIQRASNFSPRETEGGFATMNIVLKSAEDTLHEVSSRAVQTVELSEQEFHQATDLITKTPRKTPRAATAKAKRPAESLPGDNDTVAQSA